MRIHNVTFNGRQARSQFLFDQYRTSFQTSVLDIGCYEAPIRTIIDASVEYTGVDIVGDPDIELNLEECDCLPFQDSSYHTVICIKVLEHLDCLHRIMDELFRVAKKEVIVSLPNCWNSARTPIARGSGTIAHYGLPLERPVDRHKWFLSVTDITEFFCQYSKKILSLNLSISPGLRNSGPR
ncbi:MAG: methyltransferase domain-containing protein [Verrucomicrobia bacterium]|jgi:hypothetical protein|nr:methyltransferase domain-containing protein [Verrucomicrobiota bacterium]